MTTQRRLPASLLDAMELVGGEAAGKRRRLSGYPDNFWDDLREVLELYLGSGFVDVTAHGAVADTGVTDSTAAVLQAVEAAEDDNARVLYFPPHDEGKYYTVDGEVLMSKALIVMGGHNTSDTSNSIQSLAGTSRVVFTDAAGGFKWQSETTGNFLWGGGARDIRVSGTASGAAVAGRGFYGVDVSGFVFENVSAERFVTAGLHINGSSKVCAYNRVDGYRYNYGNAAESGEDSAGILLGGDHANGSVGVTHTKIGMMNCAVRDGSGLVVQGNVDAFDVGHCHTSIAGTGSTFSLVNNGGGGSQHPRRGHFGVVAGRPVVVGSSCKGHVIEHYNYDGTTAVLADMFSVASGGEIRATVSDNTSTFDVHYGARIPSVASAASLTLPDVGDFIDVTGTTNITSIAASPSRVGKVVRLRFAASCTVSDGNNLKLASDFSGTADDILTLVHDGTNYYQDNGNN